MNIVRKLVFVLSIVMILLSCSSAFLAFAGNEISTFDSFDSQEEYRALAEEKNLIAQLKLRGDSYDGEYAVLYDKIIVEYCVEDDLEAILANGKVTFSQEYFNGHPTLYVPIIDVNSSHTVTYAQIFWSEIHRKYAVFWTDLKEEVITEESLNTALGLHSSYTLLDFGNVKFVYAQENGSFYRYTSILSIRDEGKRYSIDEVSEHLDDLRLQHNKDFIVKIMVPTLLKLILVIFLIQTGAILVIGSIVLLILLLHRKSRQKIVFPNAGNDTTATEA